VNVRVGYLMINYYPPIIKSLVRRLRLIRYEYEFDENKIKLGYKDRLQAIETQISNALNNSN